MAKQQKWSDVKTRSGPIKVTIKRAYYDPQTDSVFWDVKAVASGKEATLMWLREEFGFTFNIKQELSPEIVKKFCKDMQGKTINLETPEPLQ